MKLLEKIEAAYGFKHCHWIEEPHIFQTSSGKKRVMYWDDRELMQWHIEWRDHIGSRYHVFIDRMIKTEINERYFSWNQKWITVHDEIEEPLVFSVAVEQWGEMIAAVLQAGEYVPCNTNLVQKKELDYTSYVKKLGQIKKEKREKAKLLVFLIPDVKKRYVKSQELFSKVRSPLPIIDNISSPELGKEVYSNLYLKGTNGYPISGILPIKAFLLTCWKTYGPKIVEKLLEEIEKHCSFKEQYGKMLLAEALLPLEWMECIETIEKAENDETIQRSLIALEEKWERSREFSAFILKWLQPVDEKVAL
ncbi:hypothetical protein [Pseudalkalibacillus caeni]|uniref:DUF5071 domain-containing protein n=1 Tax=Exobacillus caeni TaxID=2574798 RepID=A0A5R9F853_9BACL|nr:hypothetical protein [Pseudalkalibacillus caeni]TLS39221.1 hypothetical protein FCL54_02630 [Pseudalkalibacillus caeni]